MMMVGGAADGVGLDDDLRDSTDAAAADGDGDGATADDGDGDAAADGGVVDGDPCLMIMMMEMTMLDGHVDDDGDVDDDYGDDCVAVVDDDGDCEDGDDEMMMTMVILIAMAIAMAMIIMMMLLMMMTAMIMVTVVAMVTVMLLPQNTVVFLSYVDREGITYGLKVSRLGCLGLASLGMACGVTRCQLGPLESGRQLPCCWSKESNILCGLLLGCLWALKWFEQGFGNSIPLHQ